MNPCRSGLILLGILELRLAGNSAGRVIDERLAFPGVDRSFHLFIPYGIPPDVPVPVLLLLHGSHQAGRALLEHWTVRPSSAQSWMRSRAIVPWTATFAGAWREDSFYEFLPHARRRIPVAMFVGTRDPFFPTNTVRKTAAAFEAEGHPALLQLLKGRGHACTPVANEVNSGAWNFLRQVQADPGGTSPVPPLR